jgi:hypothetical protein
MLFWTLFTACTQDPPPVAGSIQLCIPDELAPSMETEEPTFVTGSLLDIREGSNCAAELVFQSEGVEHIVGYSILDPEGNDATFIPEWTSAENVTLSTHISFVFGMSYGLVLEDDNGIMMALDQGSWGGALKNAELPFVVEQSENDIGSIEDECMTKTGYTFKIGEDHMAPFGEFDLTIDEQDFTFVAVSAIEYGPGQSCSISDMSDEFAWGIFRE